MISLLTADEIKRAAALAGRHAAERATLAGQHENERRQMDQRHAAERQTELAPPPAATPLVAPKPPRAKR